MAFENTTKRSAQEVLTPMDSKKRNVEFAKDVTVYPISYTDDGYKIKSGGELNEFSSAIYARFVKSALDDLEKVCFLLLFVYYSVNIMTNIIIL